MRMSLISLLIALAVERYLPSANWQFSTFYRYYVKFVKLAKFKSSVANEVQDKVISAVFVLLPALICYLLLVLVDSHFFSFILSTLVLIICLGCSQTRDSYRNFLKSAFRGEPATCDDCHKTLAESKNISGLGFGQLLIWLNYRYFIAVMFLFVLFGAPGAILYRLLVTVDETNNQTQEDTDVSDITEATEIKEPAKEAIDESTVNDNETAQTDEPFSENKLVLEQSRQFLSVIDWILIRVVAFGYMLVGHFSRALPTWLDYVFNAKKPAYQLLIDVAEKSEDVQIDEDDCTAEPCTLVRLAKRTLLLCLVVLSLLIVTGVVS